MADILNGLISNRQIEDATYLRGLRGPYPETYDQVPYRPVNKVVHDRAVDWWGPPGRVPGAVDLHKTVEYIDVHPGDELARDHNRLGVDAKQYAYDVTEQGLETNVKGLGTTRQLLGIAGRQDIFDRILDGREKLGIRYRDPQDGVWRSREVRKGEALSFSPDAETIIHEAMHVGDGGEHGPSFNTRSHDYIEPYMAFVGGQKRVRGPSHDIPAPYKRELVNDVQLTPAAPDIFAGHEWDKGARYFEGQSRDDYIDARTTALGY